MFCSHLCILSMRIGKIEKGQIRSKGEDTAKIVKISERAGDEQCADQERKEEHHKRETIAVHCMNNSTGYLQSHKSRVVL